MKELSLFSGAGGGLLGTHHLLGRKNDSIRLHYNFH